VLSDVRDGQSSGWVELEDLAEEVLKLFVAFEGWSIVVSVLYFLAEPESLSTFSCKLFFEGSFFIAFELEGILMNQQVEQQYSCCPHINLKSVAILRKVFRGKEGRTAYDFKETFLAFHKLAH
jgi:hypothetical protein